MDQEREVREWLKHRIREKLVRGELAGQRGPLRRLKQIGPRMWRWEVDDGQ